MMQSINDESVTAPAWVKLWDGPTRIFHWTLVVLIGTSWWSADTGRIDLHMWSGLGVVFLLFFRLMWGVFGGTASRFSSFVKGPTHIYSYLRRRGEYDDLGHNPLGALSILVMIAILGTQTASGLFAVGDDLAEGPLAALVAYDNTELAFNIHKWTFNLVLAVIALHIVAVLFYALVLRKRLIRPMISGRIEPRGSGRVFKPGSPLAAAIIAAVALAITVWIARGAPGIAAIF